jgi:hypothetical protein
LKDSTIRDPITIHSDSAELVPKTFTSMSSFTWSRSSCDIIAFLHATSNVKRTFPFPTCLKGRLGVHRQLFQPVPRLFSAVNFPDNLLKSPHTTRSQFLFHHTHTTTPHPRLFPSSLWDFSPRIWLATALYRFSLAVGMILSHGEPPPSPSSPPLHLISLPSSLLDSDLAPAALHRSSCIAAPVLCEPHHFITCK